MAKKLNLTEVLKNGTPKQKALLIIQNDQDEVRQKGGFLTDAEVRSLINSVRKSEAETKDKKLLELKAIDAQRLWNKSSATFSLGRLDYDYKHEIIMYTWTKKHHNYRGGAFRTTVWDIDKPRKCDVHPTMKPVELVANCILDGSKEGDVILDVFGGSGTTIIAAEQMGRKACLVEIDPHYCDVILARWEKATRKKAHLAV